VEHTCATDVAVINVTVVALAIHENENGWCMSLSCMFVCSHCLAL
jgi:hypothetical protein